MLKGYDGYEWGWICGDGTRQESGGIVTGEPPKIVGIWGKIYRTDISRPCYFETNRKEEQTLGELLRVNMQQCLLFAYPEDLPLSNTVLPAPEKISVKNFRILQRWLSNEVRRPYIRIYRNQVTL